MNRFTMNEFSLYKNYVSPIDDSDDYSSDSKEFKHPSAHRTIKRYHVNNGEVEEKQDTSLPSRLENVLHFEQKEAENLSKNLKMYSIHDPFITHDLHESQINRNQARSKSNVHESYHEFETYKNLEGIHWNRDDSEMKSNIDRRRKEGHSKKVNVERSILDKCQELGQHKSQPDVKVLVSESGIPQKSITSNSHRYRAGEKLDIDYGEQKYDSKPVQEHSRKEYEKIHPSNSTRDLIGGIIAGAGVSAMLASHHEKAGKGPQDQTKNILGGAALGAVGAEVLNRARNQHLQIHSDGGGLKSTSKNSHKKIKSALGLAAAGLAAAAVATQYSHAHKARNDEINNGHSIAPSKSKAQKSRDTKNNSCSVCLSERNIHEDSRNPPKLIPNSEPSFFIDCRASKNRRSRSQTHSRLNTMTDSETIGTSLAGATTELLERCKTPEESDRDNAYNRRKSSRLNRHRSRSSVRARDKNSLSDLSSYSESNLIEYGSHPIYLTNTSLPLTEKFDSASIPDANSKLKPRNYNHQRRGSSSDSLK